jgi:hypothetical protein
MRQIQKKIAIKKIGGRERKRKKNKKERGVKQKGGDNICIFSIMFSPYIYFSLPTIA